jgi:STAS-like domain of unknown function (DUF4325)
MVISVKTITPQAYTADEGLKIARLVRNELERGKRATVSFDGVKDVPSSFVNGAFISLLDSYDPSWLRDHLKIISATRQTAEMVRRCFENAEKNKAA